MQMLPASTQKMQKKKKTEEKNHLEMTTFLFLFSVSPGFCIFIHIWRKSVEKGTCLHYNFRFSQSNCPSKFPVPRVMLLRFPFPIPNPSPLYPTSPFSFPIFHSLSPGLVALFISLPAISLACHEQTDHRPGCPACPGRPGRSGCSGLVFSPCLSYTRICRSCSLGQRQSQSQSHRRTCSCSCSCGCSWHASLLFAV